MKVRSTIAALSAAATLAGGGALALGVSADASATTASHTLKFISVQEKTVNWSKTNFGEQDKDVTRKGKIIGFDVLNFKINPKTGRANVLVTFDAKGGVMFGAVVASLGKPTSKGIITGGLGAYKAASGTIVAKALDKSGDRLAITIHYTT
jgi:hypothetical protein